MNEQTLTRKELYDLVWSKPVTKITKMFLVTDHSIRKICKELEIPLPKSGHWGKLQFNKPVEITELPSEYSGEMEITLTLRPKGDNSKGITSPLTALEKAIIAKEENELVVPDRLTNPHKLIIAARETLTKKDAYRSYQGGLVHTSRNELSITVTPENISRALRFMDTFVKVMHKRGHSINFKNDTSNISIQGEEMEIRVREKLNRLPKPKLSTSSWQEYDYLASGILVFSVKISYYYLEWKDGKLPIEKQLAKIIAKLETKGEEIRVENIRREKNREEERKKELIEQKKKQRKDKELTDFKRVLQDSKRWQEAEILRKYLDDTEAKAKANNSLTDELKDWLLWARKKADWYDPQINAADELLNENDRESLKQKKEDKLPYYSF